MSKQATLPTFGEVVPGAGGRLGAIMRGNLVAGKRQADYAIIVPDVKPVLLRWGPYKEISGASSLTDGIANTAAMLKAKCPPALYIQSVKVDEHADFYLPARGEYWALRANVPELFEKGWHWTSTQNSRYDAFVQFFENGSSAWLTKFNEFRVCPVRRIQLQHFTA